MAKARTKKSGSPGPRREREKKPEPAKPKGAVAAAMDKRVDPMLAGMLFVSLALLLTRWFAARQIGFGDSEALYVCYALHPAAAYLDHPGFVGQLARGIAGDGTPSPFGIHTVTAVLATAMPWLVVVVSRRLGAPQRAALAAGLVFAVIPVIAVGLFALTPDLPLAFTWIAALGFAGAALSEKPRTPRAAAYFMGAGLIAGVATSAKVTGLLLLVALAIVYAKSEHRRALALARLCRRGVRAGAIVSFESDVHWAMLRHRFVDTQAGAGFSIKNLGATVGGQLLYLSPVVCVLGAVVARGILWKRRNDDPVTTLLFWTFAVPAGALLVLCLWSRVAEPHWLAPPMLSLAIHAARRVPEEGPSPWSRRLVTWAAGTAFAFTVVVHAWVLVESLSSYWPFDPKANIASELYGWPEVLRATDETLREEQAGEGENAKNVWVVGPHWVVSAQLQAGMPTAHVGCTQDRTDFDDWGPREEWERADSLVFVTDGRFEGPDYDEATLFPAFVETRSQRVTVIRGGKAARTFKIIVLDRRATARAASPEGPRRG